MGQGGQVRVSKPQQSLRRILAPLQHYHYPVDGRGRVLSDALDAARHADDRVHLEQLLSDKYDEHRRGFEKLLSKIAMDAYLPEGGPLPEAIGSAALKAGQMGSFGSFLQVLCGIVYGWEGEHSAEKSPQVCAGETPDTLPNEEGGDAGRDDGDHFGDWSDCGGGDHFEEENKEVHSPGFWTNSQTAAEDVHSERVKFWNATESNTADWS